VKVTAYCRRCLARTPFDASAPPPALECGKCGDSRPINPSPAVRERNELDVCPVCGSGYFYREKDFNAWAGGAVILASIVGFLVMADRNIAIALGILLAAAALDLIVFAVVRHRYMCYQCLASMHGAKKNPAIAPYDLGTAGRFADDYDEERGRPR
jgi:hypothetical protein